MKRCACCGNTKPLNLFPKNKARKDGYHPYCKICHKNKNKKWLDANPLLNVQRVLDWKKKNLDKDAAASAKRRANKLFATPSWLTSEDLNSIRRIYTVAQDMQKSTGIKYHVDHIVPLQGNTVSGLHVPWNLTILTAEQNLSKSNRTWPDMWD